MPAERSDQPARGRSPRAGEKVNLDERQSRGRQEVGARVRELRESSGRTLPDLARDAGVSKSYLSEVESGRRLPSLDVMDQIARSLGVVVSDVLAATSTYGYGER